MNVDTWTRSLGPAALVVLVACEVCENDRDCQESGEGIRCLRDAQGDRFCGDCTEDDHCGLGSICDVTQNICVAGCRSLSGCPSGQFCDLEYETCVECRSDDDCRLGTLCDPARKSCVAGCRSDAGCPQGQVCDTQNEACVGCLEDADCPVLQYCSSQRCVECEANAQCPERQVCADSNRCVDVQCTKDDHCPGAQTCDLSRYECACSADSDCVAPHLQCIRERCLGPFGACYHRICRRWGALWCLDTHSVCRDDSAVQSCRWNWSSSSCNALGHTRRCPQDPNAWCKD